MEWYWILLIGVSCFLVFVLFVYFIFFKRSRVSLSSETKGPIIIADATYNGNAYMENKDGTFKLLEGEDGVDYVIIEGITKRVG